MKKVLVLFLLAASFAACKKEARKGVSCDTVNLQLPTKGSSIPGVYLIEFDDQAAGWISYGGSHAEKIQALKSAIELRIPVNHRQQFKIGRVFTEVFTGAEVFCASQDTSLLRSILPIRTLTSVSTLEIHQDCSGQPISPDGQIRSYGAVRLGTGDGTGKRIWIVDTGLDVDHPDLNVNVALSRNFVTGETEGIGGAEAVNDINGHGTHVGGIAGARDNGIGTLGIAAGAELVALKVLDNVGSGNIVNIIQAMDYLMVVGTPGEVVNISLGGGANSLVDLSVSRVAARGLFIAIAAGNDAVNATEQSPARTNGNRIYTVSAIDQNDRYAFYSNFGNPPIDVAQPGSGIVSTFIGGRYIFMSGTSMAAPHMAGILALKGANFSTQGRAIADPDGNPDPIAVSF
ncbi:MAG TPA: S8 family serine peptidase [Luteibaculaceae bacterium]|nr:S8 family serine peptidase [Luteibaculaceae bacterium]